MQPPQPPADQGLTDMPHHPTQLPPAQTMVLRVTRGDAVGQGSLRWAHKDGRFEVALQTQDAHTTSRMLLPTMAPEATSQASQAMLPAVDWHSVGATSADGLLPERMEVRQRGRATHAANFQQERKVATFSGPRTQQPLAAQSQDRLSWLLQLAAIAQAQPERMVAGHTVPVHVVGARGDAAVWLFTVQGIEAVVLGEPGTSTPALKLTRQATRAYDTNVELWLDPSRHHLPLRWRWQAQGSHQSATDWLRLD
jgi:hypothetical protein